MSTGTVMVATDRSETAERAVRWAADLAARTDAPLWVVRVVPPDDPETGAPADVEWLAQDLRDHAVLVAGDAVQTRVELDEDPARGIIRAAEEAGVATLVVGNAGMADRKGFLLGNVPNRVSHNARCTVIIVNTSLLDERGAPIPATPGGKPADEEPREPPLLGRAVEIGKVMAKHGVVLFARGDDEEVERRQARELRTALEELGPTFCKLGQIMSTRPDLLPATYIEELSSLQDDVPPLSEAEVVTVMEQELGVPWEDVFETIDPEPLAAGTIGQVHRATLSGGARVVVKVQRPTARDDIMRDLGLFELFAQKAEAREELKQVVDLPAVVEHLSSSLKDELDFRVEAANMDRMREILADYPRIEVPNVYHDLSTQRFMVQEEVVDACPVAEAPEGEERTEAAHQLLESFYAQILGEGFFHADPHPGNLLWSDGTVYLLDLGMVGRLDPGMREHMLLLVLAFWQNDVPFLTDTALALAGAGGRADVDVEGFRGALGEIVDDYRGRSLEEISLGPLLQRMTEVSLRYRVPLPASMALTAKSLAQVQLSAAALDPTLDPFEVAGRYMMNRLTSQIREKIEPKRLYFESQKAKARITNLLEALERVTGARPGGGPSVNFRAERLENTVRRAGRRLSLGLTSAGALLGAAIMSTADRIPIWASAAMGATGAALTVGLVYDLLRRDR